MAFSKLLYAFILLSAAVGNGANGDTQVLLSSKYECVHPNYGVHLFSSSPLVIYLSNFITPEERKHLQETTYFLFPPPLSLTKLHRKNTFSASLAADSSGATSHRSTRTSQSTLPPRDPIVRCIESRALAFQSLSTPLSHLEPLQLVSYSFNQSYHHHTDWFTSSSQATSAHGFNRLFSIFAYVAVEHGTTGGGTNFPMLEPPKGEESNGWCKFVDCDEEYENGVTFRPLAGNAIFWRNLREDGVGDDRTLHAGLPVTSGGKLGMNVWTREGPLSDEFRGPDVD
jgi:prolyl 4-hydroxylase